MPDYHDNWRNELTKCDNCRWEGLGAQLTSGEVFDDRFEVHCPQCEARMPWVIMLPVFGTPTPSRPANEAKGLRDLSIPPNHSQD